MLWIENEILSLIKYWIVSIFGLHKGFNFPVPIIYSTFLIE